MLSKKQIRFRNGNLKTVLVTVPLTIATMGFSGCSGSSTPKQKTTPTVSWISPAAVVYGTALSATQLDATASVPGSFTYSPAAGSVPTAGTDTLSVTFSPTDSNDYATATASVSLSVSQATPIITWPTPSPIGPGTPLGAAQLDATSSVAGTFVYSPPAGTVEPAGTDTLSATFTPTDSTDYATVNASVKLLVNSTATAPVITWTAPAAISYGTPLSATQLDATSDVAGSFSYVPALGSIPTVGVDTLSVTFTPSNATAYTTASATVQLTVNKATPLITWSTPAAIVNGTALSATQLDATANVGGTFLYSPAAGTIEPVGTDTLSTTFTPTDGADYTTATATTNLTVSSSSTPTALDTLSFVQQMVNLDSLAEYPGTSTTHGEVDSADPRKFGSSATCFYCDVDGGNFYGDMTINGVTQHVMLNVDGPGVITRLEALGPSFAGHNLRIYLDNSTTPAIQSDLQQLMQGESPYVNNALVFQGGTTITSVLGSGVPAPGLSLYLPIPFSQHALVTYDGPENLSLTDQPAPILDWIIEYKLLPAGTNVTSYSTSDYNNNLTAINAAIKSLSPESVSSPTAAPGPFTDAAAGSIFNQTIPAGGSATMTLPAGKNAVRFLRTNIGSSAATLAGVTLSATFDGEQTIAAVPFGDFFGAGNGTTTGGVGLNDGATMTQSVSSDGTLTSRWTMPYQSNASFTISNTTTAAVTVNLLADVSAYPWANSSMHFHAFRRVNGPFATTNDFVTRFLYVIGSGVYVGDNESVYTYQQNGDTAYNWFGEGDEMFYVDANGSEFPQRGTGTEDYYDFAYGNPSFFQAPWASQVAFAPQSNGETQFYYDGTTVYNRTRLLDSVPFTKSLRFDFEIDDHDQSANNFLQLDHTSFFYALPGATLVPDTLQSGSIYTLQSNAAGWNLDSTGGSIQTQVFKADGAQQFVVAASGSYYTIQDVSTGKYVGVPSNATAPGSLLGLVAANSGCGMFWTITPAAGNNDYYQITNQCSGLNMDLVNASTTPSTPAQVYTVNGTDAQQWRFNIVPQ